MKKKSAKEQELTKKVVNAKTTRKPKAAASKKSDIVSKKSRNLNDQDSVSEEASKSFMRTTAFTMQNKIRSAMTQIKRQSIPAHDSFGKDKSLSMLSSMAPHSHTAWIGKASNRFKVVLIVLISCGFGALASFSDQFSGGFHPYISAISSWFDEGTSDHGISTQSNEIPANNESADIRPAIDSARGAAVLIKDEVSAPKATDTLPGAPLMSKASGVKAAQSLAPNMEKPALTKSALKRAKHNKLSKNLKHPKNRVSKLRVKAKNRLANQEAK
ncbi:MAG: hypothetical protein NTX25_09590 [Proteobacteria bacterium]|nr:hypothetical protein [Pseudomonadota bacterium]